MTDYTPNIETRMGSDRNFGYIFTLAFSILALWAASNGSPLVWPAGALAVATLGVTLIRPQALHLANVGWYRFGNILHSIVSPAAMFVIYALTFVPFGIAFKLIGKDPLRRTKDATADTYWISRAEQPGSMKLQF